MTRRVCADQGIPFAFLLPRGLDTVVVSPPPSIGGFAQSYATNGAYVARCTLDRESLEGRDLFVTMSDPEGTGQVPFYRIDMGAANLARYRDTALTSDNVDFDDFVLTVKVPVMCSFIVTPSPRDFGPVNYISLSAGASTPVNVVLFRNDQKTRVGPAVGSLEVMDGGAVSVSGNDPASATTVRFDASGQGTFTILRNAGVPLGRPEVRMSVDVDGGGMDGVANEEYIVRYRILPAE